MNPKDNLGLLERFENKIWDYRKIVTRRFQGLRKFPKRRWGSAAALLALYFLHLFGLTPLHYGHRDYTRYVFVTFLMIMCLLLVGAHAFLPQFNAPTLMERVDAEFKPYEREVGELECWLYFMCIIATAFVCTFIPVLDFERYDVSESHVFLLAGVYAAICITMIVGYSFWYGCPVEIGKYNICTTIHKRLCHKTKPSKKAII